MIAMAKTFLSDGESFQEVQGMGKTCYVLRKEFLYTRENSVYERLYYHTMFDIESEKNKKSIYPLARAIQFKRLCHKLRPRR